MTSEDIQIKRFSIEIVSELLTDLDERYVREYLEEIFNRMGVRIKAINIHEKR